MVALPSTYKPAEVEAASGGTSIPAGKYKAVVLKSYEKDNKTPGSGSHVVFEYQIIEGQYKGLTIFDRFNFNNQNQKAVDIAFSQFKALAIACGKEGTMDTEALTNSIVVLTYGPQKNDSQYNEVKKYEAGTASTDGYVAPATQAAPANTSGDVSSSGKPSWA